MIKNSKKHTRVLATIRLKEVNGRKQQSITKQLRTQKDWLKLISNLKISKILKSLLKFCPKTLRLLNLLESDSNPWVSANQLLNHISRWVMLKKPLIAVSCSINGTWQLNQLSSTTSYRSSSSLENMRIPYSKRTRKWKQLNSIEKQTRTLNQLRFLHKLPRSSEKSMHLLS